MAAPPPPKPPNRRRLPPPSSMPSKPPATAPPANASGPLVASSLFLICRPMSPAPPLIPEPSTCSRRRFGSIMLDASGGRRCVRRRGHREVRESSRQKAHVFKRAARRTRVSCAGATLRLVGPHHCRLYGPFDERLRRQREFQHHQLCGVSVRHRGRRLLHIR